MTRRILALPLAILSLLAIQTAQAAEPSQAETRAMREPQPIVLSEAFERIAVRAAELDANGDGHIDAAELVAQRRHPRQGKRHQAFTDSDDARVDGISTEDFIAQRQDRLIAMDTDGDGIISVEELRQARSTRQEKRHDRRHEGRSGAHRHSPPPAVETDPR